MVPRTEFIGEQDANVEYPSHRRDVRSRKRLPYFIIHIQQDEDLDCRYAMEGDYKHQSKVEIELYAAGESSVACEDWRRGFMFRGRDIIIVDTPE